jgi:hypothetical protein
MAIKAVVVDESLTHHLIIGLTREDVESIQRGDAFTLPRGPVRLGEDSDIVVLFAETNEELTRRFPPRMRPV